MQYRPLDANGDYTVGVPFLADSPACVAQAVSTRLQLWFGEFFLNTQDGTPWLQQILRPRANLDPDAALQARILGTPGMISISNYLSTFNGVTRALSVSATLQTVYGSIQFSETLS